MIPIERIEDPMRSIHLGTVAAFILAGWASADTHVVVANDTTFSPVV